MGVLTTVMGADDVLAWAVVRGLGSRPKLTAMASAEERKKD
jgi:hypothetical protein